MFHSPFNLGDKVMKTLFCLLVLFSTTTAFGQGYGRGWSEIDNYDAFWSPRAFGYSYHLPTYYQPRCYGYGYGTGYQWGGGMGAPANLIPMNMGY